MAKKNLGKRLQCSVCKRKFYDLGRANARCPSCGGAPIVNRRFKTPATNPVSIAVEPDEIESLPDGDLELVPFDDIEGGFSAIDEDDKLI